MLEMIDRFIEGLKKARDVAQKIHDAELQNVVADLMLNSAELKMGLASLQEKNARLVGEISDLKARIELRDKVRFEEGLYYLSTPIPGYGEGPFCPVCLDRDGTLITLTTLYEFTDASKQAVQMAGWECGVCHSKHHVAE